MPISIYMKMASTVWREWHTAKESVGNVWYNPAFFPLSLPLSLTCVRIMTVFVIISSSLSRCLINKLQALYEHFFSALCLKARDSFISEQLFQAICCVLWNCTLKPHYYYPRMNDDRVKYRHECINLSPWRQRALLMIASEISIHMLSGEA